MRVLLTVEAAWHTVPGGTARVAVDLGAALSRLEGLHVTGVAARHRSDPPADFQPTVPTVHHRLPRPLLYEAWSRGPRPRIRTWRDTDVVHSTTLVVPPLSGAPLVASVHDLAFRRHPDRFPPRARRLFERAWRRVLERADAVVCPSVATSADLRAGGLEADRLHVIPLGHDPLTVDEDEVRGVVDRYGLEDQYVLATGTLEPRKNLPTLVAAYGRVAARHDVQLVLAGPRGWGESVDRVLEPLPRAQRERVVVTGQVPTRDLAALYRGATVFCYPSLLEGFGLPVLEAMSYGAPVITSSGTATEEVAGGAAVTIDPSSVDELADALDCLLGDDAARRSLSEAGLQRSRSFSWDQVAEAVCDVYRRVT